MRYVSILLLLIASMANAVEWRQVGPSDSNGGMHFVDPASIAQVKEFRKAWFKSVYTTDQTVPDEYQKAVRKPHVYRWVQGMTFFNCQARSSAAAEFSWYSAKDKGVGNFHVDPLVFRRVSAGTPDEQMLEVVCKAEAVESQIPMGSHARMVRPVNPDDYYPSSSRRHQEQGSPIVQACVGPTGALLREPDITETSGFPELDAAAVKVATATRYAAGTENGAALPESCIKFKVKFVPH